MKARGRSEPGRRPAGRESTRAIAAPPGFRWEPTIRSHGWYLLAPFRWDAATETLSRAETIGARTIDLTLSFDRGRILVSAPSLPAAAERTLRRRLGRMLQLDLDAREFLEIAAATPTHLDVARAGFARLLCSPTRFEDAVKIIATTNTTWRQTMRMVELIVDRCGSPSPGGRRAFPTPEAIAAVAPEALQEECRLGYRAKTIHALATGVAEGAIDIDALCDPSLDAEEQLRRYRSLPGIGPYGAAHMMAMDGRHDFIAVDTEFRRFVRERYHRGRKVSDATMLRRYRRWGRWQYLAYWSELWAESAGALVKFESRDE